MIKRLIGLPGDFVQINKDGSLYINGSKEEEPYIKDKGGGDGTYTVPIDRYFLLGDNRSASNDSRHWMNTRMMILWHLWDSSLLIIVP